MYFKNIDDIVKGVFLLVLAVSGNFVAETLGCKTQKLLSENMYAKHVIIVLMLYFAIGFTSSDVPTHPFEVGKTTIGIYILFLLFTKMDLTFTMVTFALLSITYITTTFIAYYKEVTPDETDQIELIEKIKDGLLITMVGTILLGFGLYYNKQYNEYYKTWSPFKFIFGVNKCKSL